MATEDLLAAADVVVDAAATSNAADPPANASGEQGAMVPLRMLERGRYMLKWYIHTTECPSWQKLVFPFQFPSFVFKLRCVFTLAGGTVESTSPPPRAQVLRQHAGLYADKSRSEFQEMAGKLKKPFGCDGKGWGKGGNKLGFHKLLSLMGSDGSPSDKVQSFTHFHLWSSRFNGGKA